MNLLNFKGYAISAAAGALIAGAVAGWGAWAIQGDIWQAKLATAQAAHDAELRAIATTAATAAEAALAKQKENEATIAEMDARLTKEKSNDQAEITRLAAAVAAGTQRLRVNAVCRPNPSGGSMPIASTAASVDDGAGPRLTDAAERNYWDLRRKIAETRSQIEGLQEYIRSTSD